MANRDSTDSNVAVRSELPPTVAVYFDQRANQPEIGRVIFALRGVTEAMDREQQQAGNMEQLNRMANLATAAAILAEQLGDRMTSGPIPSRRRQPKLPKLRAVATDVHGGAA